MAYILYEYLELALPVIARLGAIVNLRVMPGRSYEDEPVRQLESVVLPVLEGDKLNLQLIAYRAPGSPALEFEDGPSLHQALTAPGSFEPVAERWPAFSPGRQAGHHRFLRLEACSCIGLSNQVKSEHAEIG